MKKGQELQDGHNQIYFKIAGKKKNGSKGRTARHIFGREPSKDYFIKILFLLSKWLKRGDEI
jgi:hypothetical protein